ncbi:MAG: hypothetical protein QM753_15920 [Thermomicrobiales bacterium]
MNKASDLLGGLTNQIRSAIESVRPWRAQANSVSNGRVTIKPFEASAPLGELAAQLRGMDVVAGDGILIVDVAGRPFVLGAIQRGNPTARDMSASLFLKNGTQLRLYNAANSAYPIALDGANGNARFDGNLVVGGTASGLPFVSSGSGSASGSTTSTSTYSTLSTWSVTLPTGTWACSVLAQCSFQHSASGNANFRVSVGGTAGSVQTQSFFNSAYATGVCNADVTGISGTVSINLDYKSSAAGTTTAKNAGYIAYFTRQ